MKRRVVEVILILVLVSGIMLPFLEKPFHVDDFFYIQITKAVLQDPLRPYNFTINWGDSQGSGFGDYNPPLFSYFLAPVWAKWGANVVPLHLVALIFVFMAILSFYFLCNELDIEPFIPTLVLLSTPFWAVGTNLMLDTPAMGLAIPAVLFFVAGVKREKLWPLILSGVFFSLAVLTKYSALALFLPFFIYPFLSKKPRHFIPFAVGLAAFLFWNMYCFYIYGKPHFMNSHVVGRHNIYDYFGNLLAFAMVIGMTFPYALFLIRRGVQFIISLMLGIESGIIYWWFSTGPESLINGALVGAGVCLGFYLMLYIAGQIELKKEVRSFSVQNDNFFIFMMLWIAMVILMTSFFTPFVAFRYIVFMYPALIIILFKYTPLSKIAAEKMYTMIGVMFVLQLSLAYVDLRYAETYRDAASRLEEKYKNRTVWFFGHHGWHYYADAVGFKVWSKTSPAAKGDIVIVPKNDFKQTMTSELEDRLTKVENLTYELSWFPARTQSGFAAAGFYGSTIMLPPYTFSFKPLEVVDVYEVLK